MSVLEAPTSIVVRVVIALLLSSVLAVRGSQKKALSHSGAIAAFFTGLLTTLSGYRFAATLIAFFLSSSYLTRYQAALKKGLEEEFKEGGQRDWLQVLSNSGFATAAALLYLWLQPDGIEHFFILDETHYKSSMLLAFFLGYYACCNGDTWASELGILSSSQPYLITTLQRVPKGTNGGVSMRGLMASAGGGLLIGVVFWISGVLLNGGNEGMTQWPIVLLGTLAGLTGSILDSLLGGTVQYSGWCEVKKKIVSKPSPTAKRIAGQNLLSNSQVNVLSAVVTGVLTSYSITLFV